MKTRIITLTAVAGLLAALATGDALAAGRGNSGGGNGKRNATCSQPAAGTAGTTAVRPAGSQRRDGTFLTTGVTANGSTNRQGKGNGVMDGSRLTTTAPAATTTP